MAHEIAFLNRHQPAFSDAEARRIAHDHFGLQGEFAPLLSERDQNFRIRTAGRGDYVLKISSAHEDAGVVAMQCRALAHIAAQDPALPVPRLFPARNGAPTNTYTAADGTPHVIRVVHYIPGRLMEGAPNTAAMRRNLGRLLARVDLALRSFFHPSARHPHPWDLTRCPDLRPLTIYLPDENTRRHVELILDQMAAGILPRLKKVRHQIIHQDGHRGNVLLDPDRPDEIAGLIDFGDMIYAPLIAEVAVAAASAACAAEMDNPLPAIGDVAAGYDRVLPLEAEEIDLLHDLVLARYAITVTIMAARQALFPHDAPHMQDEDRYRVKLAANIRYLLDTGRARASDQLRAACRFPPYFPAPEDNTAALLARRRRLLGRHATTFYQQPLHLERGQGVWLYGADGRRYLDCYNNIPQVGHGHPHVVKAIARQAAALNTHTRYLYRAVLDYADALTSQLPDHLSACIFVNSGSEANDVAFQIARFHTGRQGAIIMADAYHGITSATAALSPDHPDVPLAGHVAGLTVPDPYTGPYRYGEPDLAAKYAQDTGRALAELAERGIQPAAFMVDTALCSSGIPAVPAGYFARVEAQVRAAGGLIIGDEVQAGFGRLGAMWGHVRRDIEADIVTMGKPVGNGFPLGVVAARPELLNAFGAATGLFSTFGGNPVACAAGLAVLDIIAAEDLVARANDVGDYWRDQIRALMPTQPLIGDVRGQGLLIGVELVTDREQRTAATAETKQLLELMRENGVLVGKTGRNGNILKIRPPLVAGREHADLFVAALDQSLLALKGWL